MWTSMTHLSLTQSQCLGYNLDVHDEGSIHTVLGLQTLLH